VFQQHSKYKKMIIWESQLAEPKRLFLRSTKKTIDVTTIFVDATYWFYNDSGTGL